MLVVFFVETGKHLRALSLEAADATSCFPDLATESTPLELPKDDTTPPLLFPSFSLVSTLPVTSQ
jgi:hypothetical protein